jgi:hypothetical protein
MVRNNIPAAPRTSYRCAAWGCPNAGCINDEGEQRPGLCWQHFRESDRKRWGAVTAEIRRTWPALANHDTEMPEAPQQDPLDAWATEGATA